MKTYDSHIDCWRNNSYRAFWNSDDTLTTTSAWFDWVSERTAKKAILMRSRQIITDLNTPLDIDVLKDIFS